jgi:lysyl-tRNA synthetase class 2
MPRVFEFARCHRADELGRYHEPEFTLLEWYRAFEPVESVMLDTEELVRSVIVALSNQSRIRHREFTVRVDQPFARLTVADAFKLHANGSDGLAMAELDPDTWFHTWVDQIEPALARYDLPVFVTDYPASQAALARKNPSDPRVAERFELYCAGVELCNGYGELTDPDEQIARFESELAVREKRGLPAIPLDTHFINALREGMPPCSGNALGFDRLVMLATGAESIAEVKAFPWDRN